ncbi:MAG: FtsH protease activity modulator HflK [Porticoccaceae bacterium]|nr:FtsH protease activity modulator HflK [Pseudomonadales bacterium]MCP5171017.1 FtsH protease activity modulator HflK [Pseudomonadales bacterium]MCP5301745.1 FtsH protease activity modulator HflK [Pseudomonadales bacterium]
MAWNEPGGDRDPWSGNSGGNRNDGPPDLDEVLKKFRKRMDGLFGGSGGSKNSNSSGSGKSLLFILVCIIAVAWGLLGFYQVDEKERAVVLRLGKYFETVGAGLHWNPPLVDSVLKVRVTEERQYTTTRSLMLTQDENIVELPLTVQYNISDVQAFVLQVKNPEISLKHATESALRHVVGSSTLDQVLSTGREKIAEEVKTRLQSYLDIYKTGIYVRTINIQEGKPPTQVKEAYDDVIKAREDRERLVNEAQAYSNGIIPEARGRAQRTIEEANAYLEKVIAEAEGEAQRFDQLLIEYRKAPEVTRQRMYLDAVQDVMSNASKVLVDVEGGNNMLYLPLDKIVQPQASEVVSPQSLSPRDLEKVAEQVIDRLRRETSNVRRRDVR